MGDKKVLIIHGTYSFEGKDGKTYRVTYKVDENGHKTYDKPQLSVRKKYKNIYIFD